MTVRPSYSFFLIVALSTSAILRSSSSNWQNNDPTQWTSDDTYQILHISAWTRPVKLKMSNDSSGGLANQTANNNSNPNTAPMTGGMNRRGGMGGGRSGGTYSSGGRSSTNSDSKIAPTEVLIQWQSALIVRMAAQKNTGGAVDASSFKTSEEYVLAVIGLPITAVGGRAASADSDATLSGDDEQRIEDHVKSSAAILRSGHEPLKPTKVELDQGADGRMLLHFSKSDPIQASEKSVEFRLATGRAELRKKFPLKDMEYEGKLEL